MRAPQNGRKNNKLKQNMRAQERGGEGVKKG